MGEDLVDDLGRVDARDDAQRAATHATVFDVDVEGSLEPLHPAHGRTTRHMGLAGGVTGRAGDDAAAEFEVRGEHAVVPGEMGAGAWYGASSLRERHFRAARRAMPNRQDCRFAQPEAAQEGCGTRMCRMKFIGSSTTWVVPSPKGCSSGYTTWPRSLTERRSFQTADGGHKHE